MGRSQDISESKLPYYFMLLKKNPSRNYVRLEVPSWAIPPKSREKLASHKIWKDKDWGQISYLIIRKKENKEALPTRKACQKNCPYIRPKLLQNEQTDIKTWKIWKNIRIRENETQKCSNSTHKRIRNKFLKNHFSNEE